LDRLKQDAYGYTARLLGVLWPPAGAGVLYFTTGVRLTPEQITQFYCAAEERHRGELESQAALRKSTILGAKIPFDSYGSRENISPRRRRREVAANHTPAESKVPNAVKERPQSRTQILRGIFDLLDLSREGVIRNVDLSFLRGLMLNECDTLRRELDPNRAQNDSLLVAGPAGAASHTGGRENERRGRRFRLMCGFAADVAIPLLMESGFVEVDFPVFSMIVMRSVDEGYAGPWREYVMGYFSSLAM
jgi:hypothetical protein